MDISTTFTPQSQWQTAHREVDVSSDMTFLDGFDASGTARLLDTLHQMAESSNYDNKVFIAIEGILDAIIEQYPQARK